MALSLCGCPHQTGGVQVALDYLASTAGGASSG